MSSPAAPKKSHLLRNSAVAIVAFLVVLIAIGAATPSTQTPSTSHASQSQVATSSSSYQSYQDSSSGFSVEIPAGWLIFRDPSPMNGEVAAGILPVLSTHPSQSAGFVVFVDNSSQVNSSSLYYPVYKEKLAQIWSSNGYGITYDSTSNMTVAGLPAFLFTYTIHFPPSVGGDCLSRSIVTVHDDVAYILELDNCSATEANAQLPEFMNFASSFAFLP